MRNTLLLFISLFLLVGVLEAQWIKISSNNAGLSGRIHTHKSVVFLYGSFSGSKVFRSTDEGGTWTNIADRFPYDIYYMYTFKDEIFAITTNLGANNYRFYSSMDDGLTWAEKSNIPSVTGNGAVLGMTSDGNTLYAISNRKSFYASTDNGLTWKESIINTTAGGNLVSFAASGTAFAAVILGTGALVSVNSGQTWEVKNPPLTLTYAYPHLGSIYGIASGSGVYKFNPSSKAWDNVSTGLPDASSFQIPKAITASGNTLYYASIGFLDSKTLIFSSQNPTAGWSAVSTAGLPVLNGAVTNNFIGVNNGSMFLYNYSTAGTTQEASIYKTVLSPSFVKTKSTLPGEFKLSQNYPNPFNPSTKISFRLQNSGRVLLKVFNILGKAVSTLVDEYKEAGEYETEFNAAGLSSGIYFYELTSGDRKMTRKMILSK